MVTIKDLAKATGYTIATVSRAFNNSSLVADATREKILRTAEEIGYLPNALARGLVNKATSTIGVIVPDITNPYFPVIVKSIQDTIKPHGYNTIVCNTDWIEDTETESAKMLFAHRVAGILMDPLSDRTYSNIYNAGVRVPIVFVGNKTDSNADEASSILIDNFSAAYQATEYLLSLGHERIAFVGGDEDTHVNRNRIGGYISSMQRHVGALDPSLLMKCRYTQEAGYMVASALIRSGRLPTAIVAGNDIIAFGVMQSFHNHGYRIPRDISIIGFDDIEFSSNIGLTTMQEPRSEMGRMAANLLLETIRNAEAHLKLETKNILLDAKLIKRDSCASPS